MAVQRENYMRKMSILLLGLLCVVPVFGQTVSSTQGKSLDRALEQAVLKQLKKNALFAPELNKVNGLLNKVAKRLEKELGHPVSAEDVVKWTYQARTADFDKDAAYEYKWRSEVPGAMKLPYGATAKEFAQHYRHSIDYAFFYVFGVKHTNALYDYGNGPCGYDDSKYAREQDKTVFAADSEMEICNLYNNLKWAAGATEDAFRTYWAWLLE